MDKKLVHRQYVKHNNCRQNTIHVQHDEHVSPLLWWYFITELFDKTVPESYLPFPCLSKEAFIKWLREKSFQEATYLKLSKNSEAFKCSTTKRESEFLSKGSQKNCILFYKFCFIFLRFWLVSTISRLRFL